MSVAAGRGEVDGGGNLVFVRHAATQPVPGQPAAEWRLAPGAMEQTAALGMALGKLRLLSHSGGEQKGPIGTIVASHEPKALATARTLGLVLGVRTSSGSGLEEHHRERVPFMPDAEFERTVRRFFARPEALVFGSETASEALARFKAGVAQALAARAGERIAIVTHGTVLALALAEANEREPFELWRSLRMPEAIIVRHSDLKIVERLALTE